MQDKCLRKYISKVFKRNPDLKFSEMKALVEAREKEESTPELSYLEEDNFKLGDGIEEHLKKI